MTFLSNPNLSKCVNCTLGDEIVFVLVKIRELIDKADDEGEWTSDLRRTWSVQDSKQNSVHQTPKALMVHQERVG